MTTQQGDSRETMAQITKLIAAESRDEVKQWEVHVRWQWTPQKAQYDDRTWVDRDAFPDWDADTKGSFPVLAEATRTKKDAKATREAGDEKPVYFDGSQDWHWVWNILRILDHAPEPVARTQGAASLDNGYGRQDDLQTRIGWNSAVNNAVHLHGPVEDMTEPDFDAIAVWANRLYAMIVAGPPQEASPSDPTADAPAPEDDLPPRGSPEPSPTSPVAQRKPGAMVAASIKTWNQDHPLPSDDHLGPVLLMNALDTVYGIVKPTVNLGIKELTLEQETEFAKAIADGKLQDLLDAAKDTAEPLEDEGNTLPF